MNFGCKTALKVLNSKGQYQINVAILGKNEIWFKVEGNQKK